MTAAAPPSVVFDASALVRAAVGKPTGEHDDWLALVEGGAAQGYAPELVFFEVANALAGYVRGGALSARRAARALVRLMALPIELVSSRQVAVPALSVALGRGLSAYDAAYIAVAEEVGATLVTADRRLAEAVPGSVLVA